MRILIANDDGIDARGIAALVDVLGKENEVCVCAPHHQRSGYSHSVTYFTRARRAWHRTFTGAADAWAVDATPADCVYYGCFAFMEEMPDLILSGINQGENLSTDCIYSGTVGAASEGLILGIPSMAVSYCSYTKDAFETAAQAARDLIPHYMQDPHRLEYLLNVNVPDLPKEQIKGYKTTMLEGGRKYEKPVDVQMQNDGSLLLVCDHVPMQPYNMLNTLEGDVTAVKNGYISITPIDNDITHHEHLDSMKGYEDIPY